jgi:hypothetical protein
MTETANWPSGRMSKFASFFRGYMGSAPIIAAALPIPVTAGKIIPTYQEHTGFLTAYCSMFCFLIVAFIFYRRHRIGAYLCPEKWGKRSRIIGRFTVAWLPLIFIILTAVSIISYHIALYTSLDAQSFPLNSKFSEMLANGTLRTVPFDLQMRYFLSYFGIFVFSTAAFSLMAMREYMQTELGLSEIELVDRVGDPEFENVTGADMVSR